MPAIHITAVAPDTTATSILRSTWYPGMPPALEGEDLSQYTDRISGADGTKRSPYDHVRFRQCSIGWHDECSNPTGSECGCPCHRDVSRLQEAPDLTARSLVIGGERYVLVQPKGIMRKGADDEGGDSPPFEVTAVLHPLAGPMWSVVDSALGYEALYRLEHVGPIPVPATDTEIVDKYGWIRGAAGYAISRATDEVVHADPCDCDEDEETAGDNCLANSETYVALVYDEGAHGVSVVGLLAGPNELNERIRQYDEQIEQLARSRQLLTLMLDLLDELAPLSLGTNMTATEIGDLIRRHLAD